MHRKTYFQKLKDLISEEVQSRSQYSKTSNRQAFYVLDRQGCLNPLKPYDYVIALGLALNEMRCDYENQATRKTYEKFMRVLRHIKRTDLPFITEEVLQRYEEVAGRPMPCAACNEDREWFRENFIDDFMGTWSKDEIIEAHWDYVMRGFVRAELFHDGERGKYKRWWLSATEAWSLIATMEHPPAEVLEVYATPAAEENILALQELNAEVNSKLLLLKNMGYDFKLKDCDSNMPQPDDSQSWLPFLHAHKRP